MNRILNGFVFAFIALILLPTSLLASEIESASISANPAATNILVGSAVWQEFIEKQLGITNNHGIRIGGAWIADIDQLFAGGVADKDRFSANSSFQLSFSIDGEKNGRMERQPI